LGAPLTLAFDFLKNRKGESMEFVNLLLLTLHNITRWIFLVLGIVVLVRSFSGWLKKSDYQDRDRKLSSMFAGIYDLQILLGIILYFTKGWAGVLMNAAGDVMKTASLRFFAVEHWLIMIIGAVIVHIASAKVKKISDSQKKYRLTAIWFAIAIILVLVSIPWPGTAANRPLLRLFGLAF
jgi:uncharacterized membrane protein